jgi:hypothetical protein
VRDDADLGPDGLGHAIGRDVGLSLYRAQDSQSLSRHLNTTLSKEVGRVRDHGNQDISILGSTQKIGPF